MTCYLQKYPSKSNSCIVIRNNKVQKQWEDIFKVLIKNKTKQKKPPHQLTKNLISSKTIFQK